MKHDEYWRRPKKANVTMGEADSWYYVNGGGIEIHVQPKGIRGGVHNHITLRLPRRLLAEYIERSHR